MEINALNTEITKTFGSEMAKVYCGSISEEELKKTTTDVFNQLTAHRYDYGKTLPSKLESLIQEMMIDKLRTKITAILCLPDVQAEITKDAQEIVKQAREKASEMLIDTIAQHMVNGVVHDPANDVACALGHNIAQEIYRLRVG